MKKKDFVEAVKRRIKTDSEATWTLLCDGLNVYKSESLVRFVAEKCEIKEEERYLEKSSKSRRISIKERASDKVCVHTKALFLDKSDRSMISHYESKITKTEKLSVSKRVREKCVTIYQVI